MATGCVTPSTEGPSDARTVNAEMEEAIAAKVQEGRARGYPDLTTIRTEAPKVPSKTQRAAESDVLTGLGTTLRDEISTKKDAAKADGTPEERAERLRAQIARDRAAAEAERPLRPKFDPDDATAN